MLDGNRDQPGRPSIDQAQSEGPLRRTEERRWQMEERLHRLDEHIRRAEEEKRRMEIEEGEAAKDVK